jgi:hypothetical protein
MVDILLIANVGFALVAVGFCAFTAYWAFSFGRALVSRVYRIRAFWTGGYAIVAIGFLVESLLYTTGVVTLQAAYFARPPGLVALFALQDSSIRTALDQDHFHRNTFHWRSLRRFLWIAILALAVLDGALEYKFGFSLEAYPLAFVIVATIIGYSAIALVVSSERTSDEPMKRFVLWLGLAGATVVISIAVSNLTSNLTATSPFLPVAIGSYFFFRAARSLSPTGHIQRNQG